MTRRLVPLDNPEAVTWARDYFATLRTKRDPWTGIHWLTIEGSRRAWCDVFKALAADDEQMLIGVIGEADRGWDLADQALRELNAEITGQHVRPPAQLETYIARASLRERPKLASTQKANSWLRYIAITYAVETLVTRFGMRGRGSKGSACALVARSIGLGSLTPKAVERIWLDYAPWLVRMNKLSAHLQHFTENKLPA